MSKVLRDHFYTLILINLHYRKSIVRNAYFHTHKKSVAKHTIIVKIEASTAIINARNTCSELEQCHVEVSVSTFRPQSDNHPVTVDLTNHTLTSFISKISSFLCSCFLPLTWLTCWVYLLPVLVSHLSWSWDWVTVLT